MKREIGNTILLLYEVMHQLEWHFQMRLLRDGILNMAYFTTISAIFTVNVEHTHHTLIPITRKMHVRV